MPPARMRRTARPRQDAGAAESPAGSPSGKRTLFVACCLVTAVLFGALPPGAGAAAPSGFATLAVADPLAGGYLAIANWDLDGYAEPSVRNGTPGAWWWASRGAGQAWTRHFICAAVPALTMTALQNPFNRSVRLTFEGPHGDPTSLRVYDQRGRFVRKLAAGGRLSLLRSLVWDGRDHAGAKVTAGTYYVVLGSGDAWLAQAVVMAP